MKKRLGLVFALAAVVAFAAYAQHGGGHGGGGGRANAPRANGGHIPAAPQARQDQHVEREVERDKGGHVNEVPHVRNDHWYGHEAPGDQRFHVDHPWEHGHFEHFGPSYRYRVIRVDRDHHRFWFPGGFFFEIAIGTGMRPRIGAGLAAMILWCMTTRITRVGIWFTTYTPECTSTRNIWAPEN